MTSTALTFYSLAKDFCVVKLLFKLTFWFLKGTESVIVTLLAKMAVPNLQRYPSKLSQIKEELDINAYDFKTDYF